VEDNTSKVYVEPAGSQPPLVSQNAAGGSQLFVINLCASIAPVSTTGRNIPGLDNYKLYQVARVEDGRTRHRLRLGFFTNEAHAERVLTVVRQQYPTAFTTSLGDEDRRFTRGYLPERAPAPAPAARPTVAVVNAAPPAAPVVAPTTAKAAPVAAAPTPAPKAAPAPAPAVAATKAPVAPPAPTGAAKPAVSKPAPAAAKQTAPAKAPPVAAKAPVDEVVEMEWEPDEATKAAVTSASLPKIKALTEAMGLDEMSWTEAAAPTPAPAREPLAVGLLSGRYAALDPSKFKSKSTATPPPAPVASKPVTPPAPAAVPPKLDTAASVRVPALTFSDPLPTPASVQKAKAGDEPYHVGKGMKIEDVEHFELDLYDDKPAAHRSAPVAKNGAAAKPPIATKPAAPVAKKNEPAAKPTAAATKPAAPIAKQIPPSLVVRDAANGHPNLDSTQTIRALTNEELSDAAQDKWFAIQLAASEQPVNLDTMPHLDIFEAYSLYSVATAGSGKIIHSLRLGFFKEAVSAEAVTGYLKTFFASPTVLRISVAEQARFKDAPQPRRADAVEEPKSNVVDLNNARGRPPVVPTITMEVDPSATGTFRSNATGAFRPGATGAVNSATGTFKPGATGAFKPNATGAFKPNATGAFKPNATGSFKLNSTGVHKALDSKVAAKSAGPATKRSEPTRSALGATGKNKMLKKSLADELMEEAREVELSESGIRKLPQNSSLLSRLLGKKK
jgi:hypothetical protein